MPGLNLAETPSMHWQQLETSAFSHSSGDYALYWLVAPGIRVALTNYGARIVGLWVPDGRGGERDVVLRRPASIPRSRAFRLEERYEILHGFIGPRRGQTQILAGHRWPNDPAVLLPHVVGRLRNLTCGENHAEHLCGV